MKLLSENDSGDVNNHSGRVPIFHPFAPGILIHIAPESLFTSHRNDYSHAPESAVVSYGDGSIESFDISGGEPVSHGDAQLSTGAANDHFPAGIDITKDGHFAVFGDASTIATIEISDLSGGKLSPTTAYDVGQGWNSGNVRLSPDESIIYVTDDSGGRVTASFFDKTTGVVTNGCSSPALSGFYNTWSYAGGVRTQVPSGTGGLLYVPEFGSSVFSSIGIVQLTVSGSICTLTEAATSPIVDNKDFSSLLSIEVYPGKSY